MYLETGLGQEFKPRDKKKTNRNHRSDVGQKVPTVSQPRAVPADELLTLHMKWGLKVPFRRDFGAFRQETAKAIGRHLSQVIQASDITNAEDWILKRENNEQRLKAIHDNLLKRAKQEFEILIVRAYFFYIRSIVNPNIKSSGVEIVSSS